MPEGYGGLERVEDVKHCGNLVAVRRKGAPSCHGSVEALKLAHQRPTLPRLGVRLDAPPHLFEELPNDDRGIRAARLPSVHHARNSGDLIFGSASLGRRKGALAASFGLHRREKKQRRIGLGGASLDAAPLGEMRLPYQPQLPGWWSMSPFDHFIRATPKFNLEQSGLRLGKSSLT